jgi:hypothetical protein
MSLVSAQIESIKHRFVQVDGIKMHIAAPSESLCKFKDVEFSGHASCDQPGQSSCPRLWAKMAMRASQPGTYEIS